MYVCACVRSRARARACARMRLVRVHLCVHVGVQELCAFMVCAFMSAFTSAFYECMFVAYI